MTETLNKLGYDVKKVVRQEKSKIINAHLMEVTFGNGDTLVIGLEKMFSSKLKIFFDQDINQHPDFKEKGNEIEKICNRYF